MPETTAASFARIHSARHSSAWAPATASVGTSRRGCKLASATPTPGPVRPIWVFETAPAVALTCPPSGRAETRGVKSQRSPARLTSLPDLWGGPSVPGARPIRVHASWPPIRRRIYGGRRGIAMARGRPPLAPVADKAGLTWALSGEGLRRCTEMRGMIRSGEERPSGDARRGALPGRVRGA